MMKNCISIVCCLIGSMTMLGQNYTSYFTGDTQNVTTDHEFGICLMGGATENDEAMKWFLNLADGGDVLVLRASGSDGYNDYFFSELGISINSVETIVINNSQGAVDPYVLQQVENAEAIWFAGGDQYDYVSYFKDTPMEDALNQFINLKEGVIGGTSAGMAILGGHYFDAANGTVTSSQAIENPYDSRVSMGHSDFLQVPFLENIINDTHYDNPDRRGRQTVFLARLAVDQGIRPIGLACEEYTSLCIDKDGKVRAFGDSPNFDDSVYVLQPSGCEDFLPEICQEGEQLVWESGLSVLRFPASNDGPLIMDLTTLDPITSEGTWEKFFLTEGIPILGVDLGMDPQCYLLNIDKTYLSSLSAGPNPFKNQLAVRNAFGASVVLYDLTGVPVFESGYFTANQIITENLSTGIYFLRISKEGKSSTQKVIKK